MALGGTCPPEPNKSRPLAPGAERCHARCRIGPLRCPAMPRSPQPLGLLLLLALAATARGQNIVVSKQWQPWLIGLTAVVVFLFIVFVVLLVNRFWQLRMRRLEKAAYSNAAADRDSEDEREHNKATSL
ncbi:LOW QUALITY PROTEIN: small integral membrane protein 24 [Aythya fuligula]|uniref:LOW QUALITY PROTEIN: small integral membrane protein 24 n=1 Tax=Aythya fuligula TaxID=219594 RepID=A0A6J3E823_AYTFU|nr:LOW QUALITY PROTEIN: small integral membrane protein 24 [Aythya fuligula]